MLQNTLPRTCPPNGGCDAAHPAIPIEQGPVYSCFQCGLPAWGLIPWLVAPTRPSPLDDWAEHIAYLKLSCAWPGASRVARLGDWITPLALHQEPGDFDTWGAFAEANLEAVRRAVAALASAIPPDTPALDPPARIVHQVLAGVISPGSAIAAIHRLLKARTP